jgi:hypothetical protein
MSDGNIKLRFVTENDFISSAIRFQAGLSVPFVPSHVECVIPLDWPDQSIAGRWLGQHEPDGMVARPAGYDAEKLMTLPDGTKSQKFVDLPCTLDQQLCFYNHVVSRIGSPYDIKSIADFADPSLNLHDVGSLICSAEMGWGLRQNPYPFFPWPLTKPLHRLSPDVLFLILSTHVEVSHTGEPA